jgi:hypothetical protein
VKLGAINSLYDGRFDRIFKGFFFEELGISIVKKKKIDRITRFFLIK